MTTFGDKTLFDTVTSLFADLFTPQALARAEAGEWLTAEWQQLEELGLPRALVPESAGGFGVDPTDALAIIRIAGAYCVPLPLVETMMANWLLARAGLPVLDAALALAVNEASPPVLERQDKGWRLHGSVKRVPWGRRAHALVVLAENNGQAFLVLLQQGEWQASQGSNLASEPRDDLIFDSIVSSDAVAELPPGLGAKQAQLLGAAMRCLSVAGALEQVLTLTVQYAGERVQFGRPIGKFQAIQQNLAVLAGQAAAAAGAADLAAEAVVNGLDALPIAAAKVRAGEAAGIGAAIAHQLHGAIGFTREHRLHFLTTRLWSWRDEFGNEAEWSRLVGQAALAAGGKGLWPLVASI